MLINIINTATADDSTKLTSASISKFLFLILSPFCGGYRRLANSQRSIQTATILNEI
ncbi:MAG: hypothetical protein SVT56_03075 [Chloroflexota bacterium]|nr:hypothetical protein [Chloroflexota bacterium]